MTGSRVCQFADYTTPWYRDRLVDLREGWLLHRKQWEFAAITQVLLERGFLAPGRRGLGFAVGEEPLPALFTAYGCEIVATDQPASEEAERGWGVHQLCRGRESLNRRGLVDAAKFDRLVSFRPVDMRAIPSDLGLYDFVWSSCSLEHLGTLEAGLDFVLAAQGHLRPGGLAVHTTEFNCSSDRDTIESGGAVLYRKSDIERLASHLEMQGDRLLPVDWSRGDHPVDRHVDEGPGSVPPVCHLKFRFGGYVTTSLLLVVERGS